MSKRYIGGTVRFDNQRKSNAVAGVFNNFKLCSDCNRYIPRTAYADHVSEEHPQKVLHIPACECGYPAYRVTAGEIGGDCENVSACDVCDRILTPTEYQ